MRIGCKIAVGSLNPVKINAVRRAFRLLCNPIVVGVSVLSGVSPQPIGLEEILYGALNRAMKARKAKNADYGVGIEAGVITTSVEPIELQAAVIVDREDGVTLGFSQAFPLPHNWLRELIERVELERVVERVLSRKGIGEKLGLIGYLTQGLVTRTDLSYNAVLMALIPRLNPKLYTSMPRIEEVFKKLGERT